ncbi:MAG: DNA polymerase I, partial [Ignavibacteria bacterium]|nr:DNA polymerase I [Ignavibacteria bacterium]
MYKRQVYGFLTSLLKIIEKEKPDYLAVALDSKEKTFRHEIYQAYKANRQVMPDDMIYQIDFIKDLLKAMNISMLIAPGYEADDIIGTIVQKAKRKGIQSFLVTPDKDYFQLIDENTVIYKPLKKSIEDAEKIDTKKLQEEFELSPNQIIDYLALVGDSSDNIPGVKGIGEVTALQLLKEFGSLDGIYANISKISKESIKSKLISQKEEAYLSKKLATIKVDCPIEYDLNSFTIENPNLSEVKKILEELEIKTLLKRIENIFGEKASETKVQDSKEVSLSVDLQSYDSKQVSYFIIKNLEELKKVISQIETQKLFALDTETDNTDSINAYLVGISLSLKPFEAYYIPIEYKQSFSIKNDFLKTLKTVLENKTITKIGQNIKYDINVLGNYGIDVEGDFFDTMVASYLIDSDAPNNLDDLAKKYLRYDTIKISELIGSKKNASAMKDVPLEKISIYSCEDVDITMRLYQLLKKELVEKNLLKLAEEIEFPLVKTLSYMELTGVNLDSKELLSQGKAIDLMLENFETEITQLAGEKFNLNSPKQLQEILFKKLGLEATKKTKTGFSTDVQSLEQLRYEHPIIEKLINYRQLTKLKSTYIESLPKLINSRTNRIHTSYNQTITSTGRLSSSDPNLQNIPIRTELGREIRRAFIPTSKEFALLSADYSQIELRILAHICEDKKLIKAFEDDLDIHSATASMLFGVSLKDVSHDMRRKAKEVNFGVLYGLGPFGLKTRLGISQSEAKSIIENYFRTYPNIKDYIDTTIKFAHENGYVETIKLRRRYLKNINSKNFAVSSFEERAAINMP